MIKSEIKEEDENYELSSAGFFPTVNLPEGKILSKKVASQKEALRYVMYIDKGIIVENHNRNMILSIPFLKDDFSLKDLKKETIQKNMKVHNCLRTQCVLPFDKLLSFGYTEGQFFLEPKELCTFLVQISFIVHYNEETNEQNFLQKLEIASKEDKITIIKSFLSYNEFLMRQNNLENSYKFLTEFYKAKNEIKFNEEESAKKPVELSLKKEYPVKFNYLILGYENFDIMLSNYEMTATNILTNLLDEVSKLKIKYISK